MFAIVQNDQIQMLVQEGTAFVWDGIQYPANWCNLSTPEEKAAIGMVDVVYGPQANQTYYWVTQDAPVYNPVTNQVDITFTSTPKDLDQTKSTCVAQINQTAYTLLFPSDWRVVKATETSTPIDPVWNTWRQSIRTTADTSRAAVEAAVDMAGVEAAMSNIAWPPSPDAPQP